MDILPVEIVLMILLRTPAPAVLNCLRASRRLRTIISKQNNFWKKHYQYGYGQHETRDAPPSDDRQNSALWMKTSLLADYWYEGVCHFYYDHKLVVSENSDTQCYGGWSFTVEVEVFDREPERFRDGLLRLTCRPLRQSALMESKAVFEWRVQDLPQRIPAVSVFVDTAHSGNGEVLLAIWGPDIPQPFLRFDTATQQIQEVDHDQFAVESLLLANAASRAEAEDKIAGLRGFKYDSKGNLWGLDCEGWPYYWPDPRPKGIEAGSERTAFKVINPIRVKARWISVSSAAENPRDDAESSSLFIDEGKVVVVDHLPIQQGRRTLQFRVYDFSAATDWDLESWGKSEKETERKESMLQRISETLGR